MRISLGYRRYRNRAALERLFDPAEWHIVIDDDSRSARLDQDVAVVVRRRLELVSPSEDDTDADDEDFLFPSRRVSRFFPGRRDVLHVRVKVPQLAEPLSILVVHLKARTDGRETTTPRRTGAAALLLDAIEDEFDDRPFVLLGDFNDNPDDACMNILETGDPNAVASKESVPGRLLLNVTEPLVAQDVVSHSTRSNFETEDGRVVTVVDGSRDLNFRNRDRDFHVKKVLFDQILIPVAMRGSYVADSAAVFAPPSTMKRASDHLPVYADFSFDDQPNDPAGSRIRVASLMPNPSGRDAGNEFIELENVTSDTIVVDDWSLIDRAQHTVVLEGALEPGERVKIVLGEDDLRLTNSGDTISLYDDENRLVDSVEYEDDQAAPGVVVSF